MHKLIIISVLCLCSTGCSWFVPGAIKREISIVRIDVDTAIKETNALEGDAAKKKALETLNRIQPHLVNINNYAQGKAADRK